MAKSERVKRERTHGFKYHTCEMVNQQVCFYCGCAATDLDHCPPISLVANVPTKLLHGLRFVLIPSCGKCNRTLGSKTLLTPRDRLSYLIGQQVLLCCEYIMTPGWGSESENLDGRLHEIVSACQVARRVEAERLRHMEAALDGLHVFESYATYDSTAVDVVKLNKKARIAHVEKCRREHIRSLLNGRPVDDSAQLEDLAAYEREIEKIVEMNIDKYRRSKKTPISTE